MSNPGRRPTRRVLFDDESYTVSLSRYPPGLRQEAHAHEEPSIALVLAGSLVEHSGTSDVIAKGGWAGFKPDGLRHSNEYGPEGAIVLSISMHSSDLWSGKGISGGWSWWKVGLSSVLSDESRLRELPPRLLACRRQAGASPGQPPAWLRIAQAELWKSPSIPIEVLALTAGVHRVHFCRSFRRWYGESVSLFRLRRRAELALCGYLCANATAASAAADAGFADQSHFTRTAKRFYGLTPGRFQAVSDDRLRKFKTAERDGCTLGE